MINRLGEKNKNKSGTEMQIIAYRNCADIDVMFLDEHGYVYRHNTYTNFKKGSIKNPYDPISIGIGYLGDGIYKATEGSLDLPTYAIWSSMLSRCYSERKKSSYFGTSTVCTEWLNYQIFAEWYEKRKYEVEGRLHLDKDILYPGNKFYSPYHCLLVPQRINMLFTNKENKRGLPNGIKKVGNKFYARYNNEELGSADTVERAFKLYAERKKEIIVEVANEYKGIIPNKVYQALLDYEVRIENDKNYVGSINIQQ